jgi:hypothetical protein
MQAAIQKNELGFANTVSSENKIILQHTGRNEISRMKIFIKLKYNLPAVLFIQHIFLSDYISFRGFLDNYFVIICHACTGPAT